MPPTKNRTAGPDRLPAATIRIPNRTGGPAHKWTYRAGEVTADVARRVRSETGMSLQRAQVMLTEDPDLDVFAAVIYAAELMSGGKRALSDIDALLDYDTLSEVQVEFDDNTAGVDDPEG